MDVRPLRPRRNARRHHDHHVQRPPLMTSPPGRATALAHPNIALVKYWGKRDDALNLPASGSLSITLDGLHTRTSVQFDPALGEDDIVLNGRRDETESHKIGAFLDLLRARGHFHPRPDRERERLSDWRRTRVLRVRFCRAGRRGGRRAGPRSRCARIVGTRAPRFGLGGALHLRRVRGNGGRHA